MKYLRMFGEFRFFLASPLIAIAKLNAWMATKVAGEEVVCFAIREAMEITDDSFAQITGEINEIEKHEKK